MPAGLLHQHYVTLQEWKPESKFAQERLETCYVSWDMNIKALAVVVVVVVVVVVFI